MPAAAAVCMYAYIYIYIYIYRHATDTCGHTKNTDAF
jgi:hypothetical protein